MANNQIEMRKVKKLFKLYTEGINNLFSNAEINEKRLLIGSIFPKNFQFEKNEVRTADINPILLKIASVNKGYKGNKKRDKSQKNDLSRLVLEVGIEPTLPKELDFESSASTSSATEAYFFNLFRPISVCKGRDLIEITNHSKNFFLKL